MTPGDNFKFFQQPLFQSTPRSETPRSSGRRIKYWTEQVPGSNTDLSDKSFSPEKAKTPPEEQGATGIAQDKGFFAKARSAARKLFTRSESTSAENAEKTDQEESPRRSYEKQIEFTPLPVQENLRKNAVRKKKRQKADDIACEEAERLLGSSGIASRTRSRKRHSE